MSSLNANYNNNNNLYCHLSIYKDTIRPICLPQYNYDVPGGTQCWISGWGYTQPDGGEMLRHYYEFYCCHKCDNCIDR